jgi:hypothetical protein
VGLKYRFHYKAFFTVVFVLSVLIVGWVYDSGGSDIFQETSSPLDMESESSREKFEEPNADYPGVRTPTISNNSGLSLLSWPQNFPIGGIRVKATRKNRSSKWASSSFRGEVPLEAGRWSLQVEASDWTPVVTEVTVKKGEFFPVSCFRKIALSVFVRTKANVAMEGVKVAWSSFPLPASLGDIEWKETDGKGLVDIQALHKPSFLFFMTSPDHVFEVENPAGFPGSEVTVVVPALGEATTSLRLVDKESGKPITIGVIEGGREIVSSTPDGLFEIPERWGYDLNWLMASAPGYQPVQSSIDTEIPSVVYLSPSVDARVQVIDQYGQPVPNAISHVFVAVDNDWAFSETRPFLPSRIVADEFGYFTIPCSAEATIQVFCRTGNGLLGNLFVPSLKSGSDYQVILRESSPLVVSLVGPDGDKIALDRKSVSARGVDKMPSAVIGGPDGAVEISTPGYVDWIQLSPKGFPSLIFTRDTFRKGLMPYSWDEAGGELKLQIGSRGFLEGTIQDETNRPIANGEFQLTLMDDSESESALKVLGLVHPAWVVQMSTMSRGFWTDINGRFQVSALLPGYWMVQRVCQGDGWIIGSGGETDPIVSVPSDGPVALAVPGVTAVNLFVSDAITGFPISKFLVGMKDDPLTNYSVGFASGKDGRWNGWVRNSVLNSLEVTSSGYRVEPINLGITSGVSGASVQVKQYPSPSGHIHFVGDGLPLLAGKVIQITDVGPNGDTFSQGRWQQRIRLSGEGIVSIAVPGGQTRLRIQFAYPGKRLVKFLPDTFDYTTGETVTIQVVPITDG